MAANARAFVITGLLGGLTTFSAFSGESLQLLDRGQFGLAGFVKEAKFHPRGVGGEDGEVDARAHAPAYDGGAHRPGLAGLQGLQGQAAHSRNTVASGGTVSTTLCARPWLATASLCAAPSGRPTLLPP